MEKRDFTAEMVDALRTASSLIEEQGYRLRCYRFRTPLDNEPQTWNYEDPEPALNQFLEELREQDVFGHDMYFNTDIKGETVANLVEHETEDDVEDAINQTLYQIWGMIDMGEPEEPEVHPLDQEVDIVYHLNTQGNYFKVNNFDGLKGEQFTYEVQEILEEEGFKVIKSP